MRMVHYFLGACLATSALLLVAALLGFMGRLDLHFPLALVAAVLAIGTHTLLILFVIVTGRVLREAVRCRDLPQSFLDELNEFFAHKNAYPAAFLGASSVVAAGVLAFGAPSLGLPHAVHWLSGVTALLVNLWAIPVEIRALRENQRLVDRAALELDRLDQAILARGEALPEEPPPNPAALAKSAFIVAFSAWMPYAYLGLVVKEGGFASTSLHPWLEISLVALLVSLLARREARRSASAQDPSPVDRA